MPHECRCRLCDPALEQAIQPADGIYGVGTHNGTAYNAAIPHNGRLVHAHHFQTTIDGNPIRYVFAVKPGEWAAAFTPNDDGQRHICCRRRGEPGEAVACITVHLGNAQLHLREPAGQRA